MRSIVFQSESVDSGVYLKPWAFLPGLCCAAAGGEIEPVEPVTVAWYLIYAAAHLADAVEDDDQPEPWWEDLGKGAAFNVATGLYLSAWRALDELYDRPETAGAAREIHQAFIRQLRIMVEGQHRDLTQAEPDTRQWLEIAGAKSGAFFQLATWAGARLATEDEQRLHHFGEFGHALGVVLQIYDDLQDLHDLGENSSSNGSNGWRWSLPLAYAMEVAPPEQYPFFRVLMAEIATKPEAKTKLIKMLEEAGASLFVAAQIKQFRSRALRALTAATRPSDPPEQLIKLIEGTWTA